ncbi:carbohydrate ABC transporter permease [Agrobacterium larrymoorei]|uniref:Carbohydrate ABC transporter permease n=2 Tax=Agrobacterium larrymoorei TaxID=160699 RepID=A0AAF0HFA6_9HYPH|nr:carbohydrate ABC transporter permease [Agrobacterium larrymoorei]QYA09097.1 carbohydrate ABC transporter permease [Agrobacterium larrymoorei]WHA43554.1 carbohydrate ABC transporter permease [Agrobacterium larrymoorei]
MMKPSLLAGLIRIFLYVLIVVIFVGPFWGTLVTAFSGVSLKPGELMLIPQQPTLENFRIAIFDMKVWRYLSNSIIVVAVGTVLQVVVSSLAAYALARKKFRGMAVVSLLILCTLMLPEEVIAIPLYLVMQKELPIINASIYDTHLAMILPVVGWAFSIFMLTEFMRAIPMELEEAARIDGANELQVFFHVILPLVRPALGTVVIFGFIMIWDQYLLPLIVVNDKDLMTLPVMLASLRVDDTITPNILTAATLVAMAPSIIVYLLLQRQFNRGVMSGAVKG